MKFTKYFIQTRPGYFALTKTLSRVKISPEREKTSFLIIDNKTLIVLIYYRENTLGKISNRRMAAGANFAAVTKEGWPIGRANNQNLFLPAPTKHSIPVIFPNKINGAIRYRSHITTECGVCIKTKEEKILWKKQRTDIQVQVSDTTGAEPETNAG